ncbi:Protein CBG04267 [Caenorhabditis briggsae]|nr:Protein CBG04267 [Caenorhabditis briggsae]CAP25009.2 Protein CBG04267 [Caenorhabditis briggsae]
MTATSSVDGLKCHQCGGAEKIPKFAKTALSKLNITVDSGCATLREDNLGVPSNQCYELGDVSNSTNGYTAKRVDCYCNKDFCNSSQGPFSTIMMTILLVLVKISM